MAETARNGTRQNILNSDGQSHPVTNLLTNFTSLGGIILLELGLIVRNAHTGAAVHIIATATGLLAILDGLYVQMISATRNQRVLIVAGIIAGFVGLAIGVSRGGFIG